MDDLVVPVAVIVNEQLHQVIPGPGVEGPVTQKPVSASQEALAGGTAVTQLVTHDACATDTADLSPLNQRAISWI